MTLELDAGRARAGSPRRATTRDFGARPLARVIQTELKDRSPTSCSSAQLARAAAASTVDAAEGELTFEFTPGRR